MTHINIQTASSIHDIDPAVWDGLGGTLPFQSRAWFVFGERVMADSSPTYLLAYQAGIPVGRAVFWLIRNEPLPLPPGLLRRVIMSALRKWPLFICRSPLANTSAVFISKGVDRKAVLSALTEAALTEGRRRGASIVLFDFLEVSEAQGWPSGFKIVQVSDPGTIMQNHWENLQEYLQASSAKNRKTYRRSLREAVELNVQIAQKECASDIEAALQLIDELQERHGSSPSPWTRAMLENIQLAKGTWLEATKDGHMIGGGLLFYDNGAQLTTSLGLTKDIPFVYFMLLYESLEAAFEKNAHLLRWGSGAYEVKQKLGFELERNNHSAIRGTNMIFRLLSRLSG